MADMITVIACESDGDEYKVLLSNGAEGRSSFPVAPGDAWASWPVPSATTGADDMDSLKQKLSVFEADNAMLQRGLDEANAVIATLTQENKDLVELVRGLQRMVSVAPIPEGLIGVTTSKVESLPSIEQFPSHPPLFPAKLGEIESPDQRDVREHLERKAAARSAVD